jgi:hypothetical protein
VTRTRKVEVDASRSAIMRQPASRAEVERRGKGWLANPEGEGSVHACSMLLTARAEGRRAEQEVRAALVGARGDVLLPHLDLLELEPVPRAQPAEDMLCLLHTAAGELETDGALHGAGERDLDHDAAEARSQVCGAKRVGG